MNLITFTLIYRDGETIRLIGDLDESNKGEHNEN